MHFWKPYYFYIWSPSTIYDHWKSFKWHINKKDVKTLKRDFSKFHSDDFIRDRKSVNWSVATQNNTNIGFENFMLIINNLLDKHAPFKEQAKRKEKLRFKPWITKDKISKEMIKAKNSQTKQLKLSLYKIIVTLLTS